MMYYTSPISPYSAMNLALAQVEIYSVEQVLSATSYHLQQSRASTIQKLILNKSQLFEHGFPIDQGSQAYIQPDKYQDYELFYTEYDSTRVCCRCGISFHVEQDGCQRIWTNSPPICQDSNGNTYIYHIHTQLPVEHLKNFKKAPKVDETNKEMSGKMFALDVESVYTSHGQAVGRVTVVDHQGTTVLDLFVRPKHVIYDYVTQYSGLTPYHMEFATETVESVREKILSLINEDSILIGHALNGDLKSLGIIHSNVIDTSVLFMKNGRRPSLRHLTSQYLRRQIQNGAGGHCSREDAVASLQLVYFAAMNLDLLKF